MSKLVSMKLDKSARDQVLAAKAPGEEGPAYPWGLQLNLDHETLEKLGEDLPDVGKSIMVMARARVVSASSSEHVEDGKTRKHRSASLQITDLCLEADRGEGKNAAELLYGKDHD